MCLKSFCRTLVESPYVTIPVVGSSSPGSISFMTSRASLLVRSKSFLSDSFSLNFFLTCSRSTMRDSSQSHVLASVLLAIAAGVPPAILRVISNSL